jgi:hypothetical protein
MASAQDTYKTSQGAAEQAVAVTPSDANDLAITSRAIYVGGAGDLTVVMCGDGSTVTFSAVPVGSVLPIRVTRVKATGTTATLILSLT